MTLEITRYLKYSNRDVSFIFILFQLRHDNHSMTNITNSYPKTSVFITERSQVMFIVIRGDKFPICYRKIQPTINDL